MPVAFDLGSYEAVVDTYLASPDSSLGWPLVDTMERHLAVGSFEENPEGEKRAKKLLARIRSKFVAADEIDQTERALETARQEYQAGIRAIAEQAVADLKAGSEPGLRVNMWNAVFSKFLEKKMYDGRLKTAKRRRRR